MNRRETAEAKEVREMLEKQRSTRYCTYCGAEAVKKVVHDDGSPDTLLCKQCGSAYEWGMISDRNDFIYNLDREKPDATV